MDLEEGVIFELLGSHIVALCLGLADFSHSHCYDGSWERSDAYLCWTQGKLFIYTNIASGHDNVMTTNMWGVTKVFNTVDITVPVADVSEGNSEAFLKLMSSSNENLEDALGEWKDAIKH